MPCACDPDLDGAAELRSVATDTWVRLWNRADPWGDGSSHVCAAIGADGLHAAVHGVTLAVWEETLTPFLEGLSEQFTGWEGTLSWQSLEPGLEVEAVFRSGGHVEMTWTLGPWPLPPSTWKASVMVVVEAGEQMRRFAVDVHQLLRPGQA